MEGLSRNKYGVKGYFHLEFEFSLGGWIGLQSCVFIKSI